MPARRATYVTKISALDTTFLPNTTLTMPTRKSAKTYPISDAQLLHLKHELHDSRRTIIGLIPNEEVRDILKSYQKCNNKDNAWCWAESTSAKIADLADARPAGEMGDFPGNSARAHCPLCGGDSEAVARGISGFAVPDGLKRHLLGSHTAKQCEVFSAALELCREYLDALGAPR